MRKFTRPVALAILSPLISQAQVVDAWDMAFPNGTQLSGVLSNNGTKIGNDSAYISVQSEELLYISTNTDGSGSLSTFSNRPISSTQSTGIVQLSYDITSASFANTNAVDGKARVAIEMRDQTDLRQIGARIEYDGSYDSGSGGFNLQYTDFNNDNVTFHSFGGEVLPGNINLRITADLDNPTVAGSFKVSYTIGTSAEIEAIGDGIVGASFDFERLRLVQQITNGGTDWRQGDTLTVDNVIISQVPEPSTYALLASLLILGFTTWRRRK